MYDHSKDRKIAESQAEIVALQARVAELETALQARVAELETALQEIRVQRIIRAALAGKEGE